MRHLICSDQEKHGPQSRSVAPFSSLTQQVPARERARILIIATNDFEQKELGPQGGRRSENRRRLARPA